MKHIFRILFIYLILVELFILVFFIFFDKRTPKESSIPFLEIQSKWADTIIEHMSVEEKIGQLILVEVSKSDTIYSDSLAYWINQYKIGGIVLKNEKQINQQLQVNKKTKTQKQNNKTESKTTCKEYFQNLPKILIPLFFASKNQEVLDYPNALSIAAIQDSSLLNRFYKTYAADAKENLIHIDFSSVLDIGRCEDTVNLNYTFGSDKNNIIRKSISISKELKKSNILSCISHFDEFYDFSVDSLHKKDSILFMYKSLVNKGVPFIQIGAGLQYRNHKQNLEKNYLKHFMNDNLDFKGLILAEPITKPKNQQHTPIQEALFSGADLIFIKSDFSKSIKEIINLIKNDFITIDELNEKVKKILLAKAWVGLEKKKTDSIKKINPINKYKKEALIRNMYENSITLIKNTKSLLPFFNLPYTSNHYVITNDNDYSIFNNFIFYYTYLSYSRQNLNNKLNIEQYRYFSNIIFIFNNKIDTIKYKLFYQSLNELNKLTNITVINFNNPENIRYISFIPTIIQTYSNHNFLQEQTAQILFGGIRPTGILPVQIDSNFRYGHKTDLYSFARFKYTIPEEVNMSSDTLAKIDTLIKESISSYVFPGCQILVAKDGKIVYHKAFGYHKYDRQNPVKESDLYDVASITKVSATTLATMKLCEWDSIHVNDSVKYYLDDTIHCTFKNHRIEEFFYHQTGMPPDMPILPYIVYRQLGLPKYGKYFAQQKDSVYSVEVGKEFYFRKDLLDTIWKTINTIKIDTTKPYKYSDINLNVVYKVISKKLKNPMDEFLKAYVYIPLGLQTMTFKPLKKIDKQRIVPTQDDKFWRQQLVHGYPQDESAAIYGGVAGNAGLFSNANDLAILFQMLINGGNYGGVSVFKPETIIKFTKQKNGTGRGLGFAFNSDNSFGHTGYTGCAVWANPQSRLIYIFLSNRIHPRVVVNRQKDMEIRAKIQNIIYKSFMN